MIYTNIYHFIKVKKKKAMNIQKTKPKDRPYLVMIHIRLDNNKT